MSMCLLVVCVVTGRPQAVVWLSDEAEPQTTHEDMETKMVRAGNRWCCIYTHLSYQY